MIKVSRCVVETNAICALLNCYIYKDSKLISHDLILWFKDTIPGIILLGAIGSILGAFVLWVVSVIAKRLFSFLRKAYDDKTSKLFLFYARRYLAARASLIQLDCKKKYVPMSALYTKTIIDKQTSSILAWVLFFILTLLFTIYGTIHLKTTVLFVSLFFLFFHDAMFLLAVQYCYDKYLSGKESDLALETYKNELTTIIELAILIKEHNLGLQDIELDKLVKK